MRLLNSSLRACDSALAGASVVATAEGGGGSLLTSYGLPALMVAAAAAISLETLRQYDAASLSLRRLWSRAAICKGV